MLGQLLRSRPSLIGLDFGETALRAAQLRMTSVGAEVTSLAQWERPSPPDAATHAAAVEDGIRRLFAGSEFKGDSVAVALNPPQVEFHVLELPRAALEGGADAEQVMHWEIGRLTSHSAEQIETRHWMLPARAGAPAGAMGVSVQPEVVRAVMDLCRRGGRRCRCVQTGATALQQFGRRLRAWDDNEVWGMLDLGARHTRLILSLGETPLLIRQTGEGGAFWTERIAQVLQISPGAAEIQKKAHGIAPQPGRGKTDARTEADDEVAVMLFSALRSELHDMAAEIKKSYEYVLGTYPGRKAADLVLAGGGALLANLPEFLSGILGIAVHRCGTYARRPECRIRVGAHGRPTLEESATAIGLALSEAKTSKGIP